MNDMDEEDLPNRLGKDHGLLLSGGRIASPNYRASTVLVTVTVALRICLAAAFTAAAVAKLAALPALVIVYDQIGLGQWFRYMTVLVEVVGVTWLALPRYVVVGAFLLGTTMAVAVFICVFILHANPFPALILASLCLTLGFLDPSRSTLISTLRPRTDLVG